MNQKAVASDDEAKPLYQRVREIALAFRTPDDNDKDILLQAANRLAQLELTEKRFKALWVALREVANVAVDDNPV